MNIKGGHDVGRMIWQGVMEGGMSVGCDQDTFYTHRSFWKNK